MALRAIVLPGLDGCAQLRSEFIAALAPEFEASVLAYPIDIPLDHEGLVAWVRARLPIDEAFVLIAESFSGPIAIELAASHPPGLVGVVLTTTYAKPPRPRLGQWRFLTRLLPPHKLPMALVMHLMMGRWSTREWRERLGQALRGVAPVVMQRRLHAAATVDVSAHVREIECPLLYLQASLDRVVFRDSWMGIRDSSGNAVCIEIEGPHMLLQAKPEECAAAIKR